MKNKDFIREWVDNPDISCSANNASNVWACNNKLYSYSTCICEYSPNDEIYIFNITKYSTTTSKHQTYLRRALGHRRYKEVDDIVINKSKLIYG